MNAKQPATTNSTETHSDLDKYATKHQAVSGAAPLWMQLRVGANLPLSFGRYEVHRVLGEGAMAAVYLAEDKQLGRQVAIKIPKFEPNDQAGMRRFFREARTMATLRHPHLCPIYDVGEIEGVHYFTMAYIEGGTLADRIESDGAMPSRRVAVLVARIASALHAAHQTGTVHRDLKPANIMIDQNNEPVVMDFGLAGLADAESNLTRSGEMIGTPAYMSPEQIIGNLDAIGPTSDVYSLGAIMYEMLTGELPFGGSVASVVQQALVVAPPAPSSVREDVDTALERICLKAMSREPAARFASADELAIALRDYLRGAMTPPVVVTATSTGSDEDRWVADAARVRELWSNERFDAALALLEKLAELTDPIGAKYAEWAAQEVPKVRAQIEQSNETAVFAATQNVETGAYQIPPRAIRRARTKSRSPRWISWTFAVPGVLVALVIALSLMVKWASSPIIPVANVPPQDSISPTNPAATSVPSIQTERLADSSESAEFVTEEPAADGPPVRPLSTEDVPLPRGEVGQPLPPRERRSVDEIFKDFDANNDGQLTPLEIPPPERPHLMRADADRNGVVTQEELDIMFLFTPGPPPRR